MPSWHIQFEISGKRLDTALTAVHELRPENLSVQPIRDRARPAPGEVKGTSRALVRQAITALGSKKFKLADLSASLNGQLTKQQLASHLHGLLKTGEIRRAGYGQFKAKAVRT